MSRNNKTVNPRSLKWVSTNDVAASVDTEGVVTGLAVGEALVIASSGNTADTTRVTVEPSGPGLRIAPDSLVLNSIGATARLEAAMDDGLGNRTPLAVAWRSLNPDVVQIDSMGRVTAKAVGSAMLIATSVCCGQADTAQARVQQVAATLSVSPSSESIAVGSTLQLLPAVLDAGDVPLAEPSIVWASSNESVAEVSSSGLVTAKSVGIVTIQARSGEQFGHSKLTVTSPTMLPTPGAAEIPLRLHRLDGRTGTVRVSSGVLLQPGQLQASSVGSVAVLVGGAEVPAYVEALHGRHRDGSVVSVLIQFDANPATQPNATLRLSTTPTQARLTKQAVDFRAGATLSNVRTKGFPAAIALPPVEHMTKAFGIFGPTTSQAEAIAMGGAFAAYESDFEQWSKTKWDAFQSRVDQNGRDAVIGSNYYDRGYHHMAWSHRTGNPEHFIRGAAYTFGFRYHYYEHNNYNIGQPRLWLSEGLAAHYWLTGDEESRRAVRELARVAYGTGGASWWNNWGFRQWAGESRPMARTISTLTWAHRLGYDGFLAPLQTVAKRLMDTEMYDGRAWHYIHPSDDQRRKYVSNFMQAMILDALITLHDHVHADPLIPGLVQRNLDYLRTQFRTGDASPSFNYYNVSGYSGGPNAAVDLNGFYVHVFAWYARSSGDATYGNVARTAFEVLSKNPKNGTTGGPWLTGDKQFNETYAKAWQYSGYVR